MASSLEHFNTDNFIVVRLSDLENISPFSFHQLFLSKDFLSFQLLHSKIYSRVHIIHLNRVMKILKVTKSIIFSNIFHLQLSESHFQQ